MGLLYAPSTDQGESLDLVDLIERHVRALIENPMLLRHISRRAMEAVDGEGATRVVRVLLEAKSSGTQGARAVQLRPASEADAALTWPWRNAESTRRYFFDPSPVSLSNHRAWWARSLQDSQRALLIGEQAGQPCGVLRFDFDQKGGAVVSLYLDPAMTGQSLGQALMLAGLAWLPQHHPQTHTVSAEILAANAASRKMFQSAGFTEQHAVFVRKVQGPW
ncbi:GNAT family N-acetyltransferase [Ideonella sp.]|uniref:GNAT family N-acetyltransferase n=1 Tax=Ideonella sp. TaxID=1929293 RepID=UPI003BB74927